MEVSRTDKAYLKRVSRYVLTAAASVLLIAYIIYHIYLSYGSSIATLTTELSQAEQKISLQAYILRNETVLYTDGGSNINYLVSDGDRVARDSRIAAAYAGQNMQMEIAQIDAQIAVLQKSDLGDNIVMTDTASIDAKLNALVLQMQRNLLEGNLDFVLRQKTDMQVLLNKRQILTNRLDGIPDKIEALQQQKQDLLAGDEAKAEYITASAAGFFYTDVDGYETLFSASDVSSMTLNSFRELIESEPQTEDAQGEGKTTVGKIVTAFTWYIACPVTTDQAVGLSVSKNYTVVFPYSDGQRVTMKLERIVTEPESDEAVLLLSSNTIISDMNYLRSQPVELVVQSYSGYKIPVSAVRIRDGEQGVYILQGSVVKYRQVEVLFESDGYFIAEPKDVYDETQTNRLGLYDLIIIKGRDLYDGKIID